MSKEENKMTLNEWIDQINAAQRTPLYGYAAKAENNKMKQLVYHNIYNRLMNILMKMYKWKLPKSLNQRVIELGLIQRGNICIYTDNKLGTYALPCIPQSLYNIYGDPIQVQVFGFNGYTDLVDIEYEEEIPIEIQNIINQKSKNKGVFARDNDMSYPYINYIEEYASKIADKLMAFDIATQRLKSPFRFAISDRDLKDTVDKMIEKIQTNDDTVIIVKSDKLEGRNIKDIIQPFEHEINPAVVDAIKNAINFDFNMFLETIGLNTNPSPDKSQVVLTPELESNNSVIDVENDVRFANRKKLCEDCKKILNIEISVEKNIDEAKQEAEKMGKELNNDTNFKEDKE